MGRPGVVRGRIGRGASGVGGWFLDFDGGGAFTQDADIEFRGGATADDTIEFETVGTGGGRFGYWFLPFLGLGLDVSYFAPKASNTGAIDTRLEVIPISALLMARLPLFRVPPSRSGSCNRTSPGGRRSSSPT